MQIIDITLLSGILTAIVAFVSAIYLLHIWTKQSNRLLTDLQLVFGITFLIQGFNMIVLSAMSSGIIPDTLDVFRIRALLICGTAIPLLIAILGIWFSKYSKYHKYVISGTILYWLAVCLIAPTRELIMIPVIPILLFVVLGLLATFVVTWKTGRLQEVRSGLLVIALLFVFISQMTKVSLMAIGLSFIADSLTSVGSILAAIALANPWYQRESAPVEKVENVEYVQ